MPCFQRGMAASGSLRCYGDFDVYSEFVSVISIGPQMFVSELNIASWNIAHDLFFGKYKISILVPPSKIHMKYEQLSSRHNVMGSWNFADRPSADVLIRERPLRPLFNKKSGPGDRSYKGHWELGKGVGEARPVRNKLQSLLAGGWGYKQPSSFVLTQTVRRIQRQFTPRTAKNTQRTLTSKKHSHLRPSSN